MAQVKQEIVQTDSFLSFWANPQEEVRESKSDLRLLKIDKSENENSSSDSEWVSDANEENMRNEKIVSCKEHGNGLTDDSISTVTRNNDVKSKKKTMKQKISRNKKYISSWTEAVENAPLSDTVRSLCKYQCPTCSKVFKNRNSFSAHLRKNKHAELPKKNFNNYLIQIFALKCHICSEKILCDSTVFNWHLRRKHKINSIKKEFGLRNLKKESKKLMLIEELDVLDSDKTREIELALNISNKCTFSCTKCDFVCQRWGFLTRHINTHGHYPLLSPLKHAKKVTSYKCSLCFELVLCDQDLMRNHLFNIHKLTLPAYRARIKLLMPAEEIHLQYLSKIRAIINHIPVIRTNEKKIVFLSEEQTTRDIGNLCFFKCPKCPRNDLHYALVIGHLRKKHNCKTFRKALKNISIEARYHKCHICKKNVLCDKTLINGHVSRNHKINYEEYKINHVLKNGGRALPTLKEFKQNRQVFDSITTGSIQSSNNIDLISPDMISSESEDSDEETRS